MTNFDFLKKTKGFEMFANVAISAENLLHIDADACALNCRRAMELAVKWMYSVDSDLRITYRNNLVSLMSNEKFRIIVGPDIWKRMDFIRRLGNSAAHGNQKTTLEQAELALENLYVFLDFVAYCYSCDYVVKKFDRSLLELTATEALSFVSEKDVDIDSLIEENKSLKRELTNRREIKSRTYQSRPLEHSEYGTRKIYIDFMLGDAGWVKDKDRFDNYELSFIKDMPTVYADCVLFGDDEKPLAVLEARRTCADIADGRKRAKLYADLLEKQFGRRPVIFLSNGFDTYIWDNDSFSLRKVAAVYSKDDLVKFFEIRARGTSPENIAINENIADRYYQKAAVEAVCDTFENKKRRKALLVMAAGSGKTRTVIALCDLLLRRGRIKNVLFLAERESLVTQAKRMFAQLLPGLPVTDVHSVKENSGGCVFSTYQNMTDSIDSVRGVNDKKLFTCGHFDLVIVDEAHRAVYNKYKDILNYFDAPLVGLTATPKDEIGRDTYDAFELENGVPTYVYELYRAVSDGFLVDFVSVESKLKFIGEGKNAYDDLSDEDKALYEDTFEDENGDLPENIVPPGLNKWLFDEKTVKQVLHILMKYGLKVDHGEKIGKTIIFAMNHDHAVKILDVFDREFPSLKGYAEVIDNFVPCAQKSIDNFSDPGKIPHIAISVDTLDTGINVPEVLNLVFFKRVMSKAKFWQMIGRGARRCDGLMDNCDKNKFYVFDFCGNFEFFRMNQKKPAVRMTDLQGTIFRLKSQIAYKLQEEKYHTPGLAAFRNELIRDMSEQVRGLNRENFAVRQHLRYVEKYSFRENYESMSCEETIKMSSELSPLIPPGGNDIPALRFDALMYGIELAFLAEKKYVKARKDLMKRAVGMSEITGKPYTEVQRELIDKILYTDYVDKAGVCEFEYIRKNLRDLTKYIPKKKLKYLSGPDDDILPPESADTD